jgi:hypothetical protein
MRAGGYPQDARQKRYYRLRQLARLVQQLSPYPASTRRMLLQLLQETRRHDLGCVRISPYRRASGPQGLRDTQTHAAHA